MNRTSRSGWLFALSVSVLLGAAPSCASEGDKFKSSCKDACVKQSKESAACGNELLELTADQCEQQCDALETQLTDECLSVYTDAYECAAKSEYTCLMGFAIPTDSECLQASLDIQSCVDSMDMTCDAYCEEVAAAGCGDQESCVAECDSDRAEYDSGFCNFEFEDLIECHTQNGVTCEAGKVAPGQCVEEVLRLGDCLTFDTSVCEAYCWTAGEFGCGGATCVAECQAKVDDASCGRDYEDVIECTLRSREASCQGSELVNTDGDCSFDQEQYDECLANP